MTGNEVADALDVASDATEPGPVVLDRRIVGRARSAASWEAAFAERTVAVDGGHLHWSGTTGARGTPVVAYGGQVETAYRLSFRWHHKREPVGNVKPTCSYPCCVAGGHLVDRLIREGTTA